MHLCPVCGKSFEDQSHCPDDGAVLIKQQSHEDLLIGSILNDTYRIEERVGEGGMGAVYRVTQLQLERSVALKVLLPKFQTTPDMVRRFFREAKNLSHLNHPNIVSIFDFGNTEDGLVYMVIEYLDGVTLQEYVKPGEGLSENVIVHIMAQICGALTAAHKAHVIHRDLKPGNIFLARVSGADEVVKVLDFGISKILDETDQQLTQTGILMGTPGYIAPEQITDGGEPGAVSDIYALGGILYFMMGGKAPFHEFTGRSAMFQQLKADPQPFDDSDLVEPHLKSLFPVVLKAMQRDPLERYQSVHDMMEDIRTRTTSQLGSTMPSLNLPESSGATDPTISLSQLKKAKSASGRSSKKSGGSVQQTPGKTSWRKVTSWVGLLTLIVIAGFLAKLVFFETEKQPLVFGMSADFSGSNRENGREMQLGIETYFNEVNTQGGILGRPLTLVALDDRYEPEPARKNALELLNQHNVFGLIGNVGTPTAEAIIPVALERKVLLFGTLSGASVLRNDPPDRYVFNYRASYQEETAAVVRYFVDVAGIPANAIAVFSQNDGFGNDGFNGVVRTLRDYNISENEILHVRYERNQFQVEEAVRAVLAAPDRAKAVITIGTYKQTAAFISSVRRTRPDTAFSSVSFVGARILAESFRENDPKLAEGVIVTQVVPFFQSNASAIIHYRDQLKIFAPNEQPSFVSLEGYLVAQLLVEGLRKVKSFDQETMVEALEQIRDLDLGTGAMLSFAPSKHQASHKIWAVVMDEQAQFKELKLN